MMQPFTTSPVAQAPRAGRLSWTGASCRPSRCWVRVRSMRNGSTESLDHLQRASKARPRQQQGTPSARRRVIQTTPFGLWDSFPEARTLDQMMRTMERIMDGDADSDRMLVVPASAVTAAPAAARAVDNGAATAAYRRGRTPWEIKERAGAYLVRYDMPGMTREDVTVSVQDRKLVVVAEKAAKDGEAVEAADGEDEGEAWPVASFGRYRTRVELPENVEVERIAAEVRDGVLYLTIPKVASGGKVVNIQVH
uniref:SHSP domain-containing protein n=1 Tax=Oryza nivara TaxID=4536 RepID=A0A0E0HSE2_ORYNI